MIFDDKSLDRLKKQAEEYNPILVFGKKSDEDVDLKTLVGTAIYWRDQARGVGRDIKPIHEYINSNRVSDSDKAAVWGKNVCKWIVDRLVALEDRIGVPK